MAEILPLVNGVAYAWTNIRINILGVTLTGITAVMYEDTQDVINNYGAGSYPVSVSKGRITCKGSLTLYMEELEALQKISPNGRIQDLQALDITVSFLPVSADPILPTTHKIRGVKFTTNKRESKEGDTKVESTIDFIAAKIDW